VGYEINFNRVFFQYQPPRPLHEIDAELAEVEKRILELAAGGDAVTNAARRIGMEFAKNLFSGSLMIKDDGGIAAITPAKETFMFLMSCIVPAGLMFKRATRLNKALMH
jgi:hypothetical protein